MKCKRCRHTTNPPGADGWAKCPHCGLGKFVGKPKRKKPGVKKEKKEKKTSSKKKEKKS